MAPKGGKSRPKGASSPSPLALYKRGLTTIRSWSPVTSAATDAEALSALADCCRQLQARMGHAPTAPASAPAPAPGSEPAPEPVTTNGHDANGHGCARDQATCAHAGVEARQPSDPRQQQQGQQLGQEQQGQGQAAETAELAAALAALGALEPGMALYGASVRHSLDLDLDDWEEEPGFLLACAHLELGKLLGRMWPPRGAASLRHLGAARALFPDFVAAGAALAQALLSRADSEGDLRQAEQLLKSSLATAESLAGGGGGDGGDGGGGGGAPWALAEVNGACRREAEEGGCAARRALAMLLCQAGRDAEASPLLAAMGYSHRLARTVLHYPLDPLLAGPGAAAAAAADPGSYERYVRAVDGALPPALLRVLRDALAPGSRFWAQHGYGRVGYFSYMHELGGPAPSAIHQAAALAHRLVAARFPPAAGARYAEWWAHCRGHPSGHQLHFDSDDEGEGGVRNPFVSCVVYLTGGIGGPTLVTPQVLGGPLAQRGWLVHPRENRLGMFDASFLHGVIPGRGPSPRPGEHRITLMIAFWRDIQCRPRADGLPGPSQPFPTAQAPGSNPPGAATESSPSSGSGSGSGSSETCRYTWMDDLPAHPDGPDGWGTADPRDAAPTAIERVWERLDGTPAQPGAVQYDSCFQGF